MPKTKVTISAVITVEHEEGERVLKKDVRALVESRLERCACENPWQFSGELDVEKVRVRDVDFD